MGECIDGIRERVARRERWCVEPSTAGDGCFRVCASSDVVLADGLTRTAADDLALSYNTARDDAEALAEHVLV